MKITRAYKVELDPNNAQKTALARHCGAARFVYNWGLNQKIEARKSGSKTPNWQNLGVTLRSVMADEFPWLKEVSSASNIGALRDLDKAYKNFFDRCKAGKKGREAGFPKFKSRKKCRGSFPTADYTIKNDSVRIARVGIVRLKEENYLPIGAYDKRRNDNNEVKFFSARITERAGRWYFSVQVEVEATEPKPRAGTVGVDVGIKALATCSDGLTFENPKALDRNLKKLRRLSRALSRKEKGGKNRKKAAAKVATLYAKISDLRTHHLHHASHVITRKSSVIGIESLNVQGMMKNRHLAKAVADASFGELLRQIRYKSTWRGGQVVAAERWFASSKTCHTCGVVNVGLTLAQRKWVCECGAAHERDLNAARNLRSLAASRAVSACGEGSSDSTSVASVPFGEAGSGLLPLGSVSPATAENGCIFPRWTVCDSIREQPSLSTK